jgi:hypothetical protein
MSGMPRVLVQLDDTVKHLRNTIRKHEDVVPPSLRDTICGTLFHWGRAIYEGATAINPGRKKIAEWSGCKDRQAGYNLSTLRDWGFLENVAHGGGGRHRKTVYKVNIVALMDALGREGVKLHPSLVDKLRRTRKWAAKGSRKGGSQCPVSGDNLLIPLSNNVARLNSRGRASRADHSTEHLPPDQDASQGVTAAGSPPPDLPDLMVQVGVTLSGVECAKPVLLAEGGNGLDRQHLRDMGPEISSGSIGDTTDLPSASPEVPDLLEQHPAEVVDIPLAQTRRWTFKDWQGYFDERAGIAEHDGGLARAEAEAQAFNDCMAEWLDRCSEGSVQDRATALAAPASMRLTSRGTATDPIPLARSRARHA